MNPTDEEIEVTAKEDIRCHVENGAGLNPYSTIGSRNEWQNGFDGKRPFHWIANPELSIPRRRGEACRRLWEDV